MRITGSARQLLLYLARTICLALIIAFCHLWYGCRILAVLCLHWIGSGPRPAHPWSLTYVNMYIVNGISRNRRNRNMELN